MKRTKPKQNDTPGLRELTRAEEQIMQVLWKLGKSFVKDIITELPEPKPAYNTVSTIVRILQDKGFVAHKAYGKTHEYYPIIDKVTYSRFIMNGMVSSYFGGSFKRMVSFFVKENDVNVKEFEDLVAYVQEDIKPEPEPAKK